MDWKTNKKGLLIVFFFWITLILAQEKKKVVYFNFDKDSKETYLKYFGSINSDGKFKGQVKIYQKYENKKGKIHFTIYGLSFIHDKKMEKAIKSIDFLKNHKVLSANQVKEFMEKKTDPKQNGGYAPFGYPEEEKGFPKLYIAEKKDSARVVLYKVRWQYYIE